MPDEHDKPAADWWAEEEALERTMEARQEAQFESELDAHVAEIYEWLEAQYQDKYERGRIDLCFEALFTCQIEKVPLPGWLIEALKAEFELAARRPVGWERFMLAAQEANEERKRLAQDNGHWFWQEGMKILGLNPTLGSEFRLAELISLRAKGSEHEAAPRTIRRRIKGILAKRSKHGQTR